MKLNTASFFKGFILTVIVTFGTHFLLLRAVNLGIEQHLLFEIYIALILISTLHFFGIQWLFYKWFKYAGFIFTALSFVKMGVCLLYLLPYIFPSDDRSIAIALNFMVVYFALLFFEVLFITKNLLKKVK